MPTSEQLANLGNAPMIQLLTMRSALWLECKGMKRHGRSVYSLVKERFGFVGNKQKVLESLDNHCQARGAKPLRVTH